MSYLNNENDKLILNNNDVSFLIYIIQTKYKYLLTPIFNN